MNGSSILSKKKLVLDSCVVNSPKTVGQGPLSKLTTYLITTKLSPYNSSDSSPSTPSSDIKTTTQSNNNDDQHNNNPTTSSTTGRPLPPVPIKTATPSSSSSSGYSVVYERKRYSDFDRFYKSIKPIINSPSFISLYQVKPPKLPPKTVLNRFDKKVIELRAAKFQEIIDFAIRNPVLVNLNQFKRLIGIDTPTMKDKEIVVVPSSPNLVGGNSPNFNNEVLFNQASSSTTKSSSNYRKTMSFAPLSSNASFQSFVASQKQGSSPPTKKRSKFGSMMIADEGAPINIKKPSPFLSNNNNINPNNDSATPPNGNGSEHSNTGTGSNRSNVIYRMDTYYESSEDDSEEETIPKEAEGEKQEPEAKPDELENSEHQNTKPNEPETEMSSNNTLDAALSKNKGKPRNSISSSSGNEEEEEEDDREKTENLGKDFNEIMKILDKSSPENENENEPEND